MIQCKNCNHQSGDQFCPKCGNAIRLERINGRYVSHQIQDLINVEKGFFYTAKELFIRPGKSIHLFISENRRKHVKPVVFLVFTSVIFALVTYFLHIEYSYFNINKIEILRNKVSTGVVGEWLNSNIGYTHLIIGCFMAFWIKIFFRKFDYNWYEILVMLCFVFGEATLLISLTFLMGKWTGLVAISMGGLLLFYLYIIWSIAQFFGRKKWTNYLKSFIILILGNISYLLVFGLIAFGIGLLWG